MICCLFEDAHVPHLRPLVNTRAAYDLRLGGRTLAETALEAFEGRGTAVHARSLVRGVTRRAHPEAFTAVPGGADVLFVNGRWVAEEGPLLQQVRRATQSPEPAAFLQDDVLVAAWCPDAAARLPDDVLEREALGPDVVDRLPPTFVDGATLVTHPWDLLDTLRPALHRDFEARTGPYNILESIHERANTTVHPSAVGVRPEAIYLAPGATVHPGAILDASGGPLYIGQNATIQAHALLRGPAYVGPQCQIKPQADIENAAFGYWSKVGGEVHDSIIQCLSNKGHAGFLGHAYLGQWCNLGADTNTSNLKNDYGTVRAYDPAARAPVDTGRQFVGLFMGDHSKCGINTMFNTGTVVGTCCNLFGGDFLPRYVPSFAWGGAHHGFATYRLPKALAVAERVMARRDTAFDAADEALLRTLFEETTDARAEALSSM